MYYVDLLKSDETKTHIVNRIEKQFTEQNEFSYFYKCAKMDGWDFINIRNYDPKKDSLLSAQYDMLLLNSAVTV